MEFLASGEFKKPLNLVAVRPRLEEMFTGIYSNILFHYVTPKEVFVGGIPWNYAKENPGLGEWTFYEAEKVVRLKGNTLNGEVVVYC